MYTHALKYTVSDIAYIGTKIILSRCFSNWEIIKYESVTGSTGTKISKEVKHVDVPMTA